MSYVYNGYARQKILTVNLTDGTSSLTDYPKEYDIVASTVTPDGGAATGITVGSYVAITDTQFAQLSLTDYQARRDAFIAYIESVESGYDYSNGSQHSLDDTGRVLDSTCVSGGAPA